MTRSSKTLTILAVTLATAASACGDGAGMTPSDDGDTKRVVAPAARFKGTWRVTSGSQVIDCGVASTTGPVVDDVTWTEGAGSDLEQHAARIPCPIRADVAGDTATGRAETCPYTAEDGITGTFTISSYAFVLDADGVTASEAFSASVTQTIRESSITCTIEKVASYRKLGR